MLDLVTWSTRDNRATTRHGGHLVGGHGSWGFQPLFHAILVSYVLLIPLSGSRTGGSTRSLILGSDVGYMCPCIFSLARFPHADSCRSYRLALLRVLMIHQSHTP